MAVHTWILGRLIDVHSNPCPGRTIGVSVMVVVDADVGVKLGLGRKVTCVVALPWLLSQSFGRSTSRHALGTTASECTVKYQRSTLCCYEFVFYNDLEPIMSAKVVNIML